MLLRYYLKEQLFRPCKYVVNNLTAYLFKCKHVPNVKFLDQFRHRSSHNDTNNLTIAKYEVIANDTLESLYDKIEEIVEANTKAESFDITLSDGILVLNFGNLIGTYVINKQTPNRQLWLSSPTSGPKRYDFIVQKQCWIYRHDNRTLHFLLQQELSNIFKQTVDLSSCLYSGNL